MIANIFGGDGMIVLIVAVVVLFGGSQLPKIAKNVGSAGREFRKGQAEAEQDATQVNNSLVATAPPSVTVPGTTAVQGAADNDAILMRRSDLRRELSDLLDSRHEQTGSYPRNESEE